MYVYLLPPWACTKVQKEWPNSYSCKKKHKTRCVRVAVSRDVEGHYFRVQYVANVLLELLTPHYRKCTRKQRIDVDHCWLILSGVFYEYTKLCLPQQFVARHHPKVPTVETSHTSFLFLESWRDVVWPHPHLLLSSVRAANGLCQVWGRFPFFTLC